MAGDVFGIGTMVDCFHSCETQPVLNESSINLFTEGAMNSVVALSILADIQSGPVALETSREFKRLQTSSSVHNKLSMLETYPMGAMAWAKRLLKQAEKKKFSISAFSSLVLAVTLPHLRTGIELDSLF